MSENNKVTSFQYKVFLKENWQHNVDRFAFVFVIGFIYSFIRLAMQNFDVSQLEIFARILVSFPNGLFAIALFEGLMATIVKIGLTPGCIIDSKLTVFKVFFKTIYAVYMNYVKDFRPVNRLEEVLVVPPQYVTLSIADCSSYVGSVYVKGYLKEPDNFI